MLSIEEALHEEMRRILYRYDCDCVPLFENLLGTYQDYEDLGDIWDVKSSPCSPDSQPPSVSLSAPASPAVDPSPTATPNPNPSLIEDSQKKKTISDIFASTSQFDINFLSELLDTTTADKFSQFQDNQLLGNYNNLRSTKKEKRRRLFNGLSWPLTIQAMQYWITFHLHFGVLPA